MAFMRQENAGKKKPLGPVKNIVLHWTAGGYEWLSDHYHIGIQGDGDVVQTLSTKHQGSHCWYRNSGALGISLCAMAPGCPVKPIQIEKMAAVVADLCGIFGLDLEGTIELPEYKRLGAGTANDRLVPTGGTVVAPVVADHAFFARADQYYPDRVDIEPLLPEIIKKAKWYREKTKLGERKNELVGKIN